MEKNLMKSQIWKEKFWLCEVGFLFFLLFFLAPVKRMSLLGPRVFSQLNAPVTLQLLVAGFGGRYALRGKIVASERNRWNHRNQVPWGGEN